MGVQILTALLIGLVTAFAFQLLLTSFGIAIGLTALGFHFATPAGPDAEVEPLHSSKVTPEPEHSTSKIGFLAGLSVLLTVNLVLFSACFLAAKFSQVSDPWAGAIAGIVIWSAYFLILTWVSSTAVSTVMGSVLGSATGGFRQLVTTITAAVTKQDDAPLTADDAIAIVRQEIQQAFSPEALDALVGPALQTSPSPAAQIDPQAVWAVVQQAQNLAEQLNQGATADSSAAEPSPKQEAAAALDDQPIAHPPDDLASSAAEESGLWSTFEAYLRHTSPKQLTPEQVSRKLEVLLEDQWEQVPTQAQPLTFERARLNQVLKRRKGVSKSQRQKILRQAEATWTQQVAQFEETLTAESSPEPDHETHSGSTRFNPSESLSAVGTYVTEALQTLEDKLPGGEGTLEAIGQNLPQLLGVSSAATGAVLQQLSQVDWAAALDRLPLQQLDEGQIEQLIAEAKSTAQTLVNKPQHWTEDYLVPQGKDLKNQVMQQVDQFQQTVQDRMDALKAQAQQRLDNTRRAAAAAAWWLSATAFTAAISAAIAGALATGTLTKV